MSCPQIADGGMVLQLVIKYDKGPVTSIDSLE
jgi:hypothetical protein